MGTILTEYTGKLTPALESVVKGLRSEMMYTATKLSKHDVLLSFAQLQLLRLHENDKGELEIEYSLDLDTRDMFDLCAIFYQNYTTVKLIDVFFYSMKTSSMSYGRAKSMAAKEEEDLLRMLKRI